MPSLTATTFTFTVFAPLNPFFLEIPTETYNALLTPPYQAHLQAALKAHILDSVIPSSALTEPTTATTLSGQNISISVDPIAVDGFVVSTPDIEASNGIVHILDGVSKF